jgi:hypothetical protein
VYVFALVMMGSYGYFEGSPFGHLPAAFRAAASTPLMEPRAGERLALPPASLAVIQALRALGAPSYQTVGALAEADGWTQAKNPENLSPAAARDSWADIHLLQRITEGAWPIRRQSHSPYKLGFLGDVDRLTHCGTLWTGDGFGIARCDD